MRRRLLLCLTAAVAVLCSCVRNSLTWGEENTPEEDRDVLDVTLLMDWSDAYEKPTGMTVYFYPKDGGTPRKVITNNVDSLLVSVPDGLYDIMVYSLTDEEYTSFGFEGKEDLSTAKVYLKEALGEKVPSVLSKTNSVMSSRGDDGDMNLLACAVARDVQAGNDSTSLQANGRKKVRVGPLKVVKHYTGLSAMKPQPTTRPIVVTANVRITTVKSKKAKAYTRAESTEIVSVSGRITGLAYEALLGEGYTTDKTYVKELPNWKIAVSQTSSNTKFGRLTTQFKSFGMPNTQLYGREEAEVPMDTIEHRITLEIDITLSDGEEVHKEFDVTDQVERQEGDDEMDIVVGAESEEDETDLNPIIDLIVEETQAGGINVSVNEWGETDVNIILKSKRKQNSHSIIRENK